LDYRHGTGHGVGSFLNVHEGPHGCGEWFFFFFYLLKDEVIHPFYFIRYSPPLQRHTFGRWHDPHRRAWLLSRW
jgi:Xaa-Pro aminopeptidase